MAKKAKTVENAEKTKETKRQSGNKNLRKENTANATTKTNKKTKETETKNKKKTDKQLQEKKSEEIQEAVGKEIKANKKIPKNELRKINTNVFKNICLAVIVMFYLDFVILGFINIDNNIFITDLKVFGMVLLAISIGLFEYAYKKDSGKYIANGIEVLVLSLVTIALIYVNLMWADKFIYITGFITYVFAIYYVAKSIVVYKKLKRQYFLNAMKEIIKK